MEQIVLCYEPMSAAYLDLLMKMLDVGARMFFC